MISCALAQNSSSRGFGRSFLFRYHNRNRIGCREGIPERVVEHLFLVPSRALRLIEVVVTWFGFRIGIHFNFSDPALNAAIVDPARDAESRRNFAVRRRSECMVRRLRQIGNTASRRLLLAVEGQPTYTARC
jgi:hypothetical protein